MIEPWAEQQLRQIERQFDIDDPCFVDGFRHGKPCPPREYRRWRWLVLVAAVVAGLVALAIGGMTPAVVTTAVFGPVGFVIAARRGWVPPRRSRIRG